MVDQWPDVEYAPILKCSCGCRGTGGPGYHTRINKLLSICLIVSNCAVTETITLQKITFIYCDIAALKSRKQPDFNAW